MSGELTFSFPLDPAEQVRVGNLVARRSRGGRLWRWAALPFLAVPLVLALLFDWPLGILWLYAIVLLLAGAAALLTPAIQRWQARRAFAAAPELRDLTYRFTEAGLLLSTPVSSAELKWDGVQEAIETDDMFLVLLVGGNVAYYVPKRVVGDRATELRRFLHRTLGPKATGVHPSSEAQVT